MKWWTFQQLKSRKAGTRKEAVERLGADGGAQAVKSLLTLTMDPDRDVRKAVMQVLKSEGYIRGYATVEFDNGRTEFEIELKYFDGEPVIRDIARVSKPGRRVYASVKNLPRVNNGLGISVLSTPKGIMADHAARDANVGGEILFTVF